MSRLHMTLSFGIACMSLLTQATPAWTQEVTIRQMGAEGRYETQLDPKVAVPRFSHQQVADFRTRTGRLIGLLNDMPETNAPPAPVCHRLKSWIEINPRHGVLAAEIGVMAPINFSNGRCHRMTGTGVVFRLNSLSLLLDSQQAHVRAADGHGDWWLLAPGVADHGVIDFGDRVAFTHGRAPLLVPVATEAYLRHLIGQLPPETEGGKQGELQRWLSEGRAKMQADNAAQLDEMRPYLKPADLAKMADAMAVVVDSTEKELRRAAKTPAAPSERNGLEAELARLSPAERAAPACIFVSTRRPDTSGHCAESFGLYALNPAYFDTKRPQTVQLIVMETPDGRTHGENDVRLATRRALWQAIDRSAVAAMVE